MPDESSSSTPPESPLAPSPSTDHPYQRALELYENSLREHRQMEVESGVKLDKIVALLEIVARELKASNAATLILGATEEEV